MGNKNRRLTGFLAKHPNCCYCGGLTPATTEDHWPPRTVFVERAWPHGYVFPACMSCQQRTANIEGMFGLICRLAPHETDDSPVALAELEKQAQGQRIRHPELMHALILSRQGKRSVLRERNLRPEPGQLVQDIPIITLGHPEIQQIIAICFQKLLLSLHYMHTRTIMPKQGIGYLRWFANGEQIPNGAFEEAAARLPHSTELKRSNNDLSTQFSYRYAVSGDLSTSAFLIVFGHSLGALGFLCNDRSVTSDSTKQWKVQFEPFEPPPASITAA